MELIRMNTSSDYEYDQIKSALWELFDSLEEVYSQELRTNNSFTIFETKPD